jgi:hypothetical protein
MEREVGWVICSENVWIALQLLNSKYSELRSAVINQKGGHDFALSSMDIVLQDS